MCRGLNPEKRLSLRILLDRLTHSGERCKKALSLLSEGSISREEYTSLLREQINAQQEWERRHREYQMD
jgi:hypothetical protein